LTKLDNIYIGVCLDIACTLVICAERNVIYTMITQGESKKIVCIMSNGEVGGFPCVFCGELIMQLD